MVKDCSGCVVEVERIDWSMVFGRIIWFVLAVLLFCIAVFVEPESIYLGWFFNFMRVFSGAVIVGLFLVAFYDIKACWRIVRVPVVSLKARGEGK